MIINVTNVNHPIPKEVICCTPDNKILCRFHHESIIGEKTIDWNAEYIFYDNSHYNVIRKGGLTINEPRIYSSNKEIGMYKYTYKLYFQGREYKFYMYYKLNIVYISVYSDDILIGEIVKNDGQNTPTEIFDYTLYFESERNLKPLVFIATIFHEHVYLNFQVSFFANPKVCLNTSRKGKKMLDLSYIERIKARDNGGFIC